MPVPDNDASPPAVRLALGSHEDPDQVVTLEGPRLRGTITGTDQESGIARVRVALEETISCRRASGAIVRVPRRRYIPPPQIERIRSSPGARLLVSDRRGEWLSLGRGCPAGARPVAVSGELWGDVTNGVGLEAVPRHIRFTWSAAARSAR